MNKKITKKLFAGVLLATTLIVAGCGKKQAGSEKSSEGNVYEVGKQVTCGDVVGTITGMVKMDNENLFTEDGSLQYDSVNDKNELVFITDDQEDSVRVRALIEGGEGVTVKEGDVLVFKYEPKNDFPFRSIYIEGLIDDPEGWDSLWIGDMNYTKGFATMEITEDFFDQKLAALRIKGDGAPEGTELDFGQIFVITDVSKPEAKSYSYEISDVVKGVATTF